MMISVQAIQPYCTHRIVEIFATISFSWIVLKDIFATLKIHNLGMIYLQQ